MRLLVLFLAGLGLVVMPGGALGMQPDSLSRRFAAANEAYTQGRYERAAEMYRSIRNAGYESGSLYHNLGNAYVRLGRVGRAIWAYERGQRLRPADPRLRHNLEYVRQREGLPLRGLPPRGLAALIAGWPPFILFGTGVLMLSMGGGMITFRAGPDRSLTGRSSVAWGLAVAGVLAVVIGLGTSYVQTHDRRAVVISEQAPLRPAPEEGAVRDSTLDAGAMVEVEARRAEWVRVRLRSRRTAWMPARVLKKI